MTLFRWSNLKKNEIKSLASEMEAYHKPRIVMLSTTKYLPRLYMLQTQIFRYNIHLKILLYFCSQQNSLSLQIVRSLKITC